MPCFRRFSKTVSKILVEFVSFTVGIYDEKAVQNKFQANHIITL